MLARINVAAQCRWNVPLICMDKLPFALLSGTKRGEFAMIFGHCMRKPS